MKAGGAPRRYSGITVNAALAHLRGPERGADRLLAHCALLEQPDLRAPAPERLRELLGADLAGLLVSALAGGHGRRFRDVA